MLEVRQTVRRFATKALSDNTLTRKAFLNSLASGLDSAAVVVVGFVLNPILVVHLGDAGFGTWQVLKRLIGHATPATGRASEALKWAVAHRQSSSDYEDKRLQVGCAVAVGLIFVPVLALLGGVLVWFAPIWLETQSAAFRSVRLAAALLVVNLILTNLTQVPRSVLWGQNLGYKRVGLSTSLLFVGGGLSVAAVLLGTGIVGLAVATLATTLLSGITFLLIVRHYVTWFGIARPGLQAVARFLRLSGWFLLWSLVMQMMTGSDIVVLGIAGSTEDVTSYTLARYMPMAILTVATIGIFGILPGLGGLIGAGDLPRAVLVRSETMCFAWLVATVAGSGVLAWEQSFLKLWVGDGYYPGTVATLLIVVMILQFTLIRIDSNIIDLTLDLRSKVLLGLFSTGLSVALAWMLLTRFRLGIAGLVAGFIVGRSLQSIAYPWMVGRVLGIRSQTQLKAMVRPGLVTGLLFMAATMIGAIASASSWAGLVLVAASSTIGLGVLAFFAGLSEMQRMQLSDRTKRLLKLTGRHEG
jgi:O-antigen/teichoic acid export membrane protein